MKDLTRWTDEQFREMKTDMDRLLRDFFRDFGAPVFDRLEGEGPVLEISEDGDRVYIRVELGDVDPDDLEISASRQTLVVKAHRQRQETRRGRLVESRHGFSNRLQLPCPVVPEEVEAVISDHHLEIRLPKCRGEVFRNIPIRREKK